MNGIIKGAVKFLIYGIFWVFVLAIDYKGQPVFYHAHRLLVENEFVETLDAELAELWDRVYNTARATLSEKSKKEEKF